MKIIHKITSIILIFLLLGSIIITCTIILKVPSNSMSYTINPGDRIIVNKLRYGIRFPFFNKSFSCNYSQPQKNDIIAFNFPEGDTVFLENPTENYYETLRWLKNQKKMDQLKKKGVKIHLGINNRLKYIKRVVGLPGDTIVINNGHCKGEKNDCISHMYAKRSSYLNLRRINDVLNHNCVFIVNGADTVVALNAEHQTMLQNKKIVDLKAYYHFRLWGFQFPYKKELIKPWNYHNYGPIYVPRKNDVVHLNMKNFPYYKRIIETYENNHLSIKDGKIFINQIETSTYTLKQNYYFVLGDLRGLSFDSRNWGFVPEDHIIGKVIAKLSPDNHLKLIK